MKMQGSIRVILGLILVFGGVGGVEANETVTFPMESISIAFAGLLIMGWGVIAVNRSHS